MRKVTVQLIMYLNFTIVNSKFITANLLRVELAMRYLTDTLTELRTD